MLLLLLLFHHFDGKDKLAFEFSWVIWFTWRVLLSLVYVRSQNIQHCVERKCKLLKHEFSILSLMQSKEKMKKEQLKRKLTRPPNIHRSHLLMVKKIIATTAQYRLWSLSMPKTLSSVFSLQLYYALWYIKVYMYIYIIHTYYVYYAQPTSYVSKLYTQMMGEHNNYSFWWNQFEFLYSRIISHALVLYGVALVLLVEKQQWPSSFFPSLNMSKNRENNKSYIPCISPIKHTHIQTHANTKTCTWHTHTWLYLCTIWLSRHFVR